MALRDFSLYTNPLIEPAVDTAMADYFLEEMPNALSETKPVSLVYKRLTPTNIEPSTSSQTTDLAVEMEQLRLKLLLLLQQDTKALTQLSQKSLGILTEGVDYSVNHSKVVSDKVVQNTSFVQLDLADLPTTAVESSSGNTVTASGIHFFPALLIKIAEDVGSRTLIDQEYKRQVMSCRRELQNVRQKIIVKNTGLVAFLAFKYKTNNLSVDDLLQEGMVGLIRAVDRFDPERGLCFSTYAVFWIKQAISRLIVKQEKVIRLPVALAEKASVVFDIMRRCYLEHQRWPTDAELQAQCSLSKEEIKTVSSYYQATHSLDASLSDENDDYTLMDNLKQQQFALPLNELIDTDLSHYLSNVIASLPEQEATIINLRFGLKNQTEMTLQAIADQLQVTRERVRQIQNQALKKLKQQFGYDLLPFLEANDNY